MVLLLHRYTILRPRKTFLTTSHKDFNRYAIQVFI